MCGFRPLIWPGKRTKLAKEACIWFNAINECAVADFLSGALSFQKITQMVEQGLQAVPGVQISEIEQAMASDQAARRWYREAIQ